MAMHSAATPEGAGLNMKTWPQKLRREFGRLLAQSNTLTIRPRALTTRTQFLFILGHMRSGSTLLCHLLCNSSEIVGFGETHNNYRRRSDLAKLLISVRKHTGKNPTRHRYVLDKIVGGQHILNTAVLNDRRTRYIFLIREPRATIASIVAMRRQFQNESADQSLAFAIEHYSERLAQLRQLAQTIDDPQRCLLVTHRQLLGETEPAFWALETFLGLTAPMCETYAVMPTAGQPGIGDPSPNIRLGKIDRSLPRKHIALPPLIEQQLEQRYEMCAAKLGEMIQTPEVNYRPTHRRAA